MTDAQTFFKALLNDIRVDVSDEFDQNFTRKAFFDKSWQKSKFPNNKGSLMVRTGAGRRSIRNRIQGLSIIWSSSLPYMGIHNEGGTIKVTAQMKKFFWAMYYKSSKAIAKNDRTGEARNTKRNRSLAEEAEIWKSMALMKIGSNIKIPQRRFIGPHRQVDAIVKKEVDKHMQKLKTWNAISRMRRR